MGKVKIWIEAMRLRTLPVSLAGVVTGVGYALSLHGFSWLPALLCLVFALLAQIASNFANEYYDFRAGLDAPGRVGPRRGVTEGDITPRAMLYATYATLMLACFIGCVLIWFGGWWILPVGIVIAIGAMAYSAGPYPLSHHGMGEVAVILFFGVIPVSLTCYLQTHQWSTNLWLGAAAIGLLGANVLIVNNYRDAEADAKVGKHTLAVILGRRTMLWLYAANALTALGLMLPSWWAVSPVALVVPAVTLLIYGLVVRQMHRREGKDLNPLLGITAMIMFGYSLLFALTELFCA